METAFSAVPSYLGYAFQGMYGLVLLLDADDDCEISIETLDDVVLEGNIQSLFQIKHSDSPGSLTVKNDGLWKTIRIWSQLLKADKDNDFKFIFVTSSRVDKELEKLCDETESRDEVFQLFETEAKRVVRAVQEARERQEKLPYQKRYIGCKEFLDLPKMVKRKLINNIRVAPNTFNIRDISQEVEKCLKTVIPSKRNLISERLIEWWDYRVIRGLTGNLDRKISKLELISQIQDLIVEHSEDYLPDDFSGKTPENLDDELKGKMSMQIDLVQGGSVRKQRAARVRWQARNQRERWLDDNLLSAIDLTNFDNCLITVWNDRHGPMKEDLIEVEADAKKMIIEGRNLLDWSHHEAHKEINSPKKGCNYPFLVQGTYQELSEDGRVGWHPNYIELLEMETK